MATIFLRPPPVLAIWSISCGYMYLRILKVIDEEVVDRDVIRSQQVNFVNCFKNCNATISIGENISPTERGTIKQKLITYSILYNIVLPNI